MQNTSSLIACAILVIASIWTDVRTQRIPNSVVLVGIVAGLSTSMLTDGIGILNSLMGGSLGLILFLPFYFYRILGAGDAKLLMAIGTFSGSPGIVYIALITGISGGILALLMAVYYQSFVQVAKNTHSAVEIFVSQYSLRKKISAHGLEISKRKFPYAIAIGTGTLIYFILRIS